MEGGPTATRPPDRPRAALGDELEAWLRAGKDTTLGGLAQLFGPRSFALVFVLLLGVPALPLPTGGATHVFEIAAVVVAAQLIAGRDHIWLPRRWARVDIAAPHRRRLLHALLRLVRRLERLSRPRLRFLFHHRLSDAAFGCLAATGAMAAFVAPPFSGLDTLPALGVVLLSLGVLLEDAAIAVLGVVVGAVGVALEVALGAALLRAIAAVL